MKKSLKVLAFAIALAGLASCGQKPAEFTSVRYDNSFALEEGASDSISITMDIEYPEISEDERGKAIAAAITGTAFGNGYESLSPAEAMEAWADSLVAEYRESNLSLKEMLEKIALSESKEPANLEEQAISLIGADLYEKLIKGYTEKQWGRKCTELPSFIIRRLPVRFVYDNNYFSDKYQGIPIGGYNKLIEGLLDGTEVITDTDFFENREHWEQIAEKIVFTGKIDEFYNYRFGKLEYRTVYFEEEELDCPNYQGNAVVNYTDKDVPYTRVIEHKHFEMFGEDVGKCAKTIISREYSIEWNENLEPYYPINDSRNNELHLKYKALADKETRVIFGGRLAEYKYYDMAPIIEKVLDMDID